MSTGYAPRAIASSNLRAERTSSRGELVVADDAPRLAHADVHSALHHVRFLEAGHVAPQELRDLAHLPAAHPFGVGEVPDVGAEHARDARAVHAHLAFVRRGEEKDVLARQLELAGRGRLAHEVPQAVHAAPLLRVLLDVGLERRALELGHAEHERHRLHQAVGAPDLDGRPPAPRRRRRRCSRPSPSRGSPAARTWFRTPRLRPGSPRGSRWRRHGRGAGRRLRRADRPPPA